MTSLHGAWCLTHTVGTAKGEHRMVEKFQAQVTDDLEALQNKITKLEIENGVLRGQLGTMKKDLSDVNAILSSIQEWAGKTDRALEQLEDDGVHLHAVVAKLESHSCEDIQLLRFPNPIASDGDEVHFLPSSSPTSDGSSVASAPRNDLCSLTSSPAHDSSHASPSPSLSSGHGSGHKSSGEDMSDLSLSQWDISTQSTTSDLPGIVLVSTIPFRIFCDVSHDYRRARFKRLLLCAPRLVMGSLR